MAATYPRVRVAHGTLTCAQVKAAKVIVPPAAGRTINVVDVWMRNVGTNISGPTSIVLESTDGTDVTSTGIATFNSNVLLRAGASGVTSTNVGTNLVPGKGLRIAQSGGTDMADSTGLDYTVFYTVTS